MLYRLWSRAIAVPVRWSRPHAKQKNRSATVPPTADSLMAFRVSEAKVMRVRRLGVDCVVPGRALRVQRPGETIVRLPPRKDGPPGGTDAAALQPPEAYRRGGSLQQRFPVRPPGGRGDPPRATLLLGLPEVRRRIGPRGPPG